MQKFKKKLWEFILFRYTLVGILFSPQSQFSLKPIQTNLKFFPIENRIASFVVKSWNAADRSSWIPSFAGQAYAVAAGQDEASSLVSSFVAQQCYQ